MHIVGSHGKLYEADCLYREKETIRELQTQSAANDMITKTYELLEQDPYKKLSEHVLSNGGKHV